MDNAIQFLTIMAALSAATQTLTDHLVKRRSDWLNLKKLDPTWESRRHMAIHLVAAILGGLLAYTTGIKPLELLHLQALPWLSSNAGNALVAGVLVSFGGSFFNESLSALREFKKAQEALRRERTAVVGL